VGFLGIMEKFNNEQRFKSIKGRAVREIIINFGNFYAARLFIDHLSAVGGQLNLNITEQCLNTPECATNLILYIAIGVLGLRTLEQIFWRKITKGGDGTERRDGGFKYQ